MDLIVKKQFINACSEESAMYLLESGPRYLKGDLKKKPVQFKKNDNCASQDVKVQMAAMEGSVLLDQF